MNKPTYLFVLPWSPEHAGGVNQVVLSLARQMQVEGEWNPLILICDWAARKPVWGQCEDIPTVRWRIRSLLPGKNWRIRLVYRLWEWRFRSQFSALCREYDICAINPHFVGDTAFAFERLRHFPESSIPLLLSIHGTDVTLLGQLPEVELTAWRALLPRVSAVVACSNNLAARFQAVFGDLAVLRVVHNGIHKQHFDTEQSRPHGLAAGYILSVGKFEPQKGQDVLLEAFARLREAHQGVSLVLVGARDRSLEDLQAQVRRLRLDGQVFFFTDRPHVEMSSYYAHALFFVLPSRMEAFPLVILEAGAAGLPVIATHVGGVPEAIEDGKTGCLVPPDSVSALADAMGAFMDDPAKATAMGLCLQERVRTVFLWDEAYRQYRHIILQAHGTRDRRLALG